MLWLLSLDRLVLWLLSLIEQDRDEQVVEILDAKLPEQLISIDCADDKGEIFDGSGETTAATIGPTEDGFCWMGLITPSFLARQYGFNILTISSLLCNGTMSSALISMVFELNRRYSMSGSLSYPVKSVLRRTVK